MAESFFATLKREVLEEKYEDRRVAHQAVAEYMFYDNTRRRYSAVGYGSPIAFEFKMSCSLYKGRLKGADINLHQEPLAKRYGFARGLLCAVTRW